MPVKVLCFGLLLLYNGHMSEIPKQERLSLGERAKRVGNYILEGLALAGQIYVGMPIDPTETQGYKATAVRGIESYINDPKNH